MSRLKHLNTNNLDKNKMYSCKSWDGYYCIQFCFKSNMWHLWEIIDDEDLVKKGSIYSAIMSYEYMEECILLNVIGRIQLSFVNKELDRHCKYTKVSWDGLYIMYRPEYDKWVYYEYLDSVSSFVERGDVSDEVINSEDLVKCVLMSNGTLQIRDDKFKLKENEMGKDVNYVGGDYKIAVVTYEVNEENLKGRRYNFKCDIDIEIAEGDLVVVEDSNGFNLVKVIKSLENCMQNCMELYQILADCFPQIIRLLYTGCHGVVVLVQSGLKIVCKTRKY